MCCETVFADDVGKPSWMGLYGSETAKPSCCMGCGQEPRDTLNVYLCCYQKPLWL